MFCLCAPYSLSLWITNKTHASRAHVATSLMYGQGNLFHTSLSVCTHGAVGLCTKVIRSQWSVQVILECQGLGLERRYDQAIAQSLRLVTFKTHPLSAVARCWQVNSVWAMEVSPNRPILRLMPFTATHNVVLCRAVFPAQSSVQMATPNYLICHGFTLSPEKNQCYIPMIFLPGLLLYGILHSFQICWQLSQVKQFQVQFKHHVELGKVGYKGACLMTTI